MVTRFLLDDDRFLCSFSSHFCVVAHYYYYYSLVVVVFFSPQKLKNEERERARRGVEKEFLERESTAFFFSRFPSRIIIHDVCFL